LKNSPPESAGELKARALRLLARREHTRAELAKKLAPHAASDQAVEALLDGLVAQRLLSEARYAEERARVLARKFGAARIRHDLRLRGVAPEVADRLAAGGELERAIAIVRRRYPAPADSWSERARRARFLERRGFSHATIRAALGAATDESEDV